MYLSLGEVLITHLCCRVHLSQTGVHGGPNNGSHVLHLSEQRGQPLLVPEALTVTGILQLVQLA